VGAGRIGETPGVSAAAARGQAEHPEDVKTSYLSQDHEDGS
jgi:hypothetical protein